MVVPIYIPTNKGSFFKLSFLFALFLVTLLIAQAWSFLCSLLESSWGFPGSLAGKESAYNAGNPGSGRSPGEGIGYPLQYSWGSLVAQLVKNPPAMWETWVPSLGWEGSPGEGNGDPIQYCGLENSMDYIVCGVTKSRTWLSDFPFTLLQRDKTA